MKLSALEFDGGSGRGYNIGCDAVAPSRAQGIAAARTAGMPALPLPGAFTTPADTCSCVRKNLNGRQLFVVVVWTLNRVRCHLHSTTLRLLLQCSTDQHSVKVMCTSFLLSARLGNRS